MIEHDDPEVFDNDENPQDQPDDDALGRSIYYQSDPVTGGGSFIQNGMPIGQITPNFVRPGDFRYDSYLASRESDMEGFLDSLDFNMDDVNMPWTPLDTPITDDNFVGNPIEDTNYWQPQTTGFTCAVQAQRGIIETYTGHSISEAELVYHATAHGWLTDKGMLPHDAGNLLEIHGIPTITRYNATVEDLMSELAQGHRVIVGVNSSQLYGKESPMGEFVEQAADHAIWVTGIDTSDPSNPQVIINDSGMPDGAGKAYDLEVFANAWQDSGFFYVATTEPPPDFSLAASGFDATKGEFPNLVSYYENKFGDFKGNLQDEQVDVNNEMDVDTLFRLI